ncbi:MAG: hypothetical protein K2P94_18130 [Rhodospirillaceae bacterium]|nr:hypothetical protein [Rhodospirillaceae bacterium]
MNYFAPMSPNDIWRAKALIAQYPKQPQAYETMDVRYDGGVSPPLVNQTMDFRYDRDPPSQTVPLSTNDAWRARALIAEYPAKKFGAEADPASKEQMDDYFRNLGGPMPPPPQHEGIQEGMPVDRPMPTFQSPGEIQGRNMDDLYGRLAEARANYQESRSGFERAGDYALESANDFARSMANAATLSSADNIAAAFDSAFINDDDYEKNLARQRAETEAAQKRSPVATAAGVLAGGYAGGKIAKIIRDRLGRKN